MDFIQISPRCNVCSIDSQQNDDVETAQAAASSSSFHPFAASIASPLSCSFLLRPIHLPFPFALSPSTPKLDLKLLPQLLHLGLHLLPGLSLSSPSCSYLVSLRITLGCQPPQNVVRCRTPGTSQQAAVYERPVDKGEGLVAGVSGWLTWHIWLMALANLYG